MNILATKSVIEGKQINVLHKQDDIWIVLSNDDVKNQESLKDNLYFLEEEELFSRIPRFREHLNHKNETTINIDYETGEFSVNPKHFHIGIPTHGAKATRQANTSFSIIRWIKNNFNEYKTKFIIVGILLILSMYIGWFFYIPLIAYVAFQVLATLKQRDMFFSGNLCPGIVIDEENSKIAVYTDLSMGFGGQFPIIRIKKVNLPKSFRKKDQRLAIAGTYQTTEGYNHWDYFDPLPLISGMKNPKEHTLKVNEIHSSEWIKLKNEIGKMGTTPKEGYHPIEIETTSWKDKDLNAIKFTQFSEEK